MCVPTALKGHVIVFECYFSNIVRKPYHTIDTNTKWRMLQLMLSSCGEFHFQFAQQRTKPKQIKPYVLMRKHLRRAQKKTQQL